MTQHIALEAPFAWQEPAYPDFAALHARYPALAEISAELGNTDLIEVPSLPGAARIFAKCEWQNPYGSIKDRVAYALICDALQKHGERPLSELKIMEYSGGNLAAALSGIAAKLGLAMRFVLSSAAGASLLDLLAQRGARVDLVDKELGFLEVIRHAIKIAEQEPEWQLLYQHRNALNVAFHRNTTGAEILQQLPLLAGQAKPRAWLASIGTGGSLIGVAQALLPHFPDMACIGVTPSELPYGSDAPPNGLPKYGGSGGLGHGIRQPFVQMLDAQLEQYILSFPEAISGMAQFYHATGIKIGSSAAANWLKAREIASRYTADEIVLTVFPCAGTPEEWKRALS